MAIAALTPARKAAQSTVALKAVMAVTGLIMIGYLLAHMYGNLKIFSGEAAFNSYAHHLRILGEPILPRSGALWIIRAVLVVSVLAHMYAAFNLWARAQRARGGVTRYYSRRGRGGGQRVTEHDQSSGRHHGFEGDGRLRGLSGRGQRCNRHVPTLEPTPCGPRMRPPA